MVKTSLEQYLAKSKNALVHDTKIFDQSSPDITTCENICTAILNSLSQGTEYTENEYRDIFFRSSKLFKTRATHLRRLVNLLIKTIPEEESFMVTSSLTSDMNDKNDLIRANAIRTLGIILDNTTAPMYERFIKTGIVEKNPHVAAAALACGLRFCDAGQDMVKRWSSEVTQALESSNGAVQYLALVLLHRLRKQDRLAQHKLVAESLSKKWSSPASGVLLIKYCADVIAAAVERGTAPDNNIIEYIHNACKSSGRSGNLGPAARLEACSVLVNLAEADSEASPNSDTAFGISLLPVVNGLVSLMSSARAAERFGGARLASRLANVRPALASKMNSIFEELMKEENRNIAGIALTTLLKTVKADSVDNLVKQMTTVMADAPVALKIDAVNAVRSLCLQYPAKHKAIFRFIQSPLRDETSVELKALVVDTLMELTEAIEEARGLGLAILCEYIEDCEFPSLSARVLSFIAAVGPKHPQPAKFVRFIYNRVLLENATVRAAAVDALARLAVSCPDLKGDIQHLLGTAIVDADDEVRARASTYSELLAATPAPGATTPTTAASNAAAEEFFGGEDSLGLSLDALCDSLQTLLEDPETAAKPFVFEPAALDALPTPQAYRKEQEAKAKASAAAEASQAGPASRTTGNAPAGGALGGGVAPGSGLGLKSISQQMSEQAAEVEAQLQSFIANTPALQAITGGATLGPLISVSSRLQQQAEQEADYAVASRKFFYAKGLLVCQMSVTNTLDDGVLRNVGVELSNYDASKWTVIGCQSITILRTRETANLYLVLHAKSEGLYDMIGSTFACRLRFHACDDEDDTEGFEDVYGIEALKLTSADFFRPRALKTGEFKMQWESNGTPTEPWTKAAGKALKLPPFNSNLAGAVQYVLRVLNMSACDECHLVPAGASVHNVLLSGIAASNAPLLVLAQIAIHPQHGCLLKMSASSPDAAAANAAVEAPK